MYADWLLHPNTELGTYALPMMESFYGVLLALRPHSLIIALSLPPQSHFFVQNFPLRLLSSLGFGRFERYQRCLSTIVVMSWFWQYFTLSRCLLTSVIASWFWQFFTLPMMSFHKCFHVPVLTILNAANDVFPHLLLYVSLNKSSRYQWCLSAMVVMSRFW